MKEYTVTTLHDYEVEVENYSSTEKRIVININDFYEIDDYVIWGYEFDDFISEDLSELSKEEIKKEFIKAAEEIDKRINEYCIGEEWDLYAEQIENDVRNSFNEDEDFIIHIKFIGEYSNTKTYVERNIDEIVEEFKYWIDEAKVEENRIKEMTAEEKVKEIEELYRNSLPEWIFKNHDDECK